MLIDDDNDDNNSCDDQPKEAFGQASLTRLNNNIDPT